MEPRRPSVSGRITLDGDRLTLEQLERIARGAKGALARTARRRISASRRTVLDAVAGGATVYGVNTGFGKLAHVHIDEDKLDELQLNLLRSHSAGVGPPLGESEVRALLALRANCLARGHSGVRAETVDHIVGFLNAGIHPVVPEQGSVGASGDLAPLAHLGLTLTGEGEVFFEGRRMPASRAMRRAGLTPLRLEAKEGLALVNGTQMMTAVGGLALLRAERLACMADVAGAMSLEALKGSHRALDRRIHEARAHPGQLASAANLRRLLRDSAIERSHAHCGRVQDAYSLRCMPQIHGAVRDTLAHVRRVLTVELNASTDNPMVFAERGDLLSGGNFHGHPVAVALDHLAVGACSLATVSERRIERLMNPDTSGLPAFLARNPGLHSGFMLAHVTAASLVSENKALAHPASVDTIPTSAGQEDHVSMGAWGARKAARVVDHVATVIAIEVLAAAQALEFLRPLRAGRGVEAAFRAFRRRVKRMDRDRVVAEDIARAREAVEEQALRDAAERVVGKLE